jgi:hypothetical protein
MNRRFWFEKCSCSEGGKAHGYFCGAVEGRCPIPTMSLEMGNSMLEFAVRDLGLSVDEAAEVKTELLAAGLEESSSEGEKQLVAIAAQAVRIGIPVQVFLALLRRNA